MGLFLLSSMPGMRVKPNEISYSAAISVHVKGSKWERALALLQEVQNAR